MLLDDMIAYAEVDAILNVLEDEYVIWVIFFF